jgi:hypothetical protein
VELTESVLSHIDEVEGQINAFATVTADVAPLWRNNGSSTRFVMPATYG